MKKIFSVILFFVLIFCFTLQVLSRDSASASAEPSVNMTVDVSRTSTNSETSAVQNTYTNTEGRGQVSSSAHSTYAGQSEAIPAQSNEVRSRNVQRLEKIQGLDSKQVERLSALKVESVDNIAQLKRDRIERLSQLDSVRLNRVSSLSKDELDKLTTFNRAALKDVASQDVDKIRQELQNARIIRVKSHNDLSAKRINPARKAQLEQKFEQVRQSLGTSKETINQIRANLTAAKNGRDEKAILENSKNYLLKSAEILISQLEKVKIKVQEDENIDANEESSLVAEIDSEIENINSIKSEVSAAETKEQIKSLANELQAMLAEIRSSINLGAIKVISAQIKGLVNQGTVLEKKLDAVLAKMKEKNINVDVNAQLDQFSAKIADAKDKQKQAQAEIAEALELKANGEPANSDKIKLLSEEAKELLKQAQSSLKEAHELLKAIVKKIKEAGPSINISDEGDVEIVVETPPKPSISLVEPLSGAIGTSVTITGFGFTSQNQIHFGIGGANASSTDGKTLSFKIPLTISGCDLITASIGCRMLQMDVEAGTYSLYVSNENGNSNPIAFTVIQLAPVPENNTPPVSPPVQNTTTPPTFSLPPADCSNAFDYTDPTYGSKVRQLVKEDGHEHNHYYWRNPFNADNTLMFGIRSDLNQQNWQMTLYNGDGCFIKKLWNLGEFDWRIQWDRKDLNILYVRKGSALYKYNVVSSQADLLKSFNGPYIIGASSISLNQAGDRIFVLTSDGMVRSYQLPDMSNERSFKLPWLGTNCTSDYEDERYIGYKNYIATGCYSKDLTEKKVYIFDDDGTLLHEFDGPNANFGHSDFSPDGKWAYFKMYSKGQPLEIHMVNIDGTDDKVMYTVSQAQAMYVRNLHLSWPDKVNDWFVAGFFPFDLTDTYKPAAYAPPLDEILQIKTDGTTKFLARTGTELTAGFSNFWAQTLASPSADGSRISFNSVCANNLPNLGCKPGSIDNYILYT